MDNLVRPGRIPAAKQIPDRESPDGTERLCRKCCRWWLLESFRPVPGCRGGRRFACRSCDNVTKLASLKRARALRSVSSG